MEELDRINKKFDDLAIGIFPFMSKNRVTILKKGFHKKHKADYRGVTMIYDKRDERHKALLFGYFYVPKNYVVVPAGLTITDGKKKLIADKIDRNYEVITTFPSLVPFEFEEGSDEYKVAQQANDKFKLSR